MKNLVVLMMLSVALCSLEGCKKNTVPVEVFGDTLISAKTDRELPAPKLTQDEVLIERNREIIQKLKAGDYISLADDIHPEKGIRFSMFAYISDTDKLFSVEDFQKYVQTPIKFTWGKTDGEGKDVILSLADYLKTWVFKRDFSIANVTVNEFQGHGNSLNNLPEKYPAAMFTENYISGTKQYSGMDWNALRLVFAEFNGKFYLIAIVNDQWTI